jgi:transposase
LDYHQDSVQVCVVDGQGRTLSNRSVSNRLAEIEQAVMRHGRPRRIAIEACCGAADLAECLSVERGLPVELAHPGYVHRLRRSPDKTDLSDAQLLADLTRVNYLPTVWLAPRKTRELRRLMRHRCQLVRRRKDVKLRIRGLLRENRVPRPRMRAWTKAWLTWLAEAPLTESDRWILEDGLAEIAALTVRLSAVEKRIRQAIQDDPLVARLLTLSGVGLVTAGTLRAEVGRFDRFDTGKQLARFCGVTPRNVSSGARQADAGLVRAGNPELRTVLIELAHRLIHDLDSHWARLATGMLKRGKPKNVVIAAVANRWVRWLHHELRRDPASADSDPRTLAAAAAPDLGSGSTKGAAPSDFTIAST